VDVWEVAPYPYDVLDQKKEHIMTFTVSLDNVDKDYLQEMVFQLIFRFKSFDAKSDSPIFTVLGSNLCCVPRFTMPDPPRFSCDHHCFEPVVVPRLPQPDDPVHPSYLAKLPLEIMEMVAYYKCNGNKQSILAGQVAVSPKPRHPVCFRCWREFNILGQVYVTASKKRPLFTAL
jgi:hypothetical protein